MNTALASPTETTFEIAHEIQINASPEITFDALLRRLGPENKAGENAPMPMVLEPRPGGRWYRDLGNDNGHFWGLVQAIKRPTLLEMTGPLFMSYAAVSNIQYRLEPNDDGTLLRFKHSAYGLIDPDHRDGLANGWSMTMEQVKTAAETSA